MVSCAVGATGVLLKPPAATATSGQAESIDVAAELGKSSLTLHGVGSADGIRRRCQTRPLPPSDDVRPILPHGVANSSGGMIIWQVESPF